MMVNTVKFLEKRLPMLKAAVQDTKNPSECVDALMEQIKTESEKARRIPAAPPPEGGIGIRAASRKYGIPDSTLVKWVKYGFITILRKDRNWTYLKEADIIPLAEVYQEHPGSGKRAVVKKARAIKKAA